LEKKKKGKKEEEKSKQEGYLCEILASKFGSCYVYFQLIRKERGSKQTDLLLSLSEVKRKKRTMMLQLKIEVIPGSLHV